jgi:hypothetical protein
MAIYRVTKRVTTREYYLVEADNTEEAASMVTEGFMAPQSIDELEMEIEDCDELN